jgi:hypothetical protein
MQITETVMKKAMRLVFLQKKKLLALLNFRKKSTQAKYLSS